MNAPLYAQPFAKFSESVIAITVTPTMDKGRLRMLPSSQKAEMAFGRLGEALRKLSPGDMTEKQQGLWINEQLDRLLAYDFGEDVFFGSLANRHTVMLIKDIAEKDHGVEMVMRRVHAAEVVRAAREGIQIPGDVASEYREELAFLNQPAHAMD